ncbi:MAG: hypothetical protein CME65_14575 [Halobacteriovoraceae bacterium]|nr:hypothetical protein [Halobacteriovoraceae bacterium]
MITRFIYFTICLADFILMVSKKLCIGFIILFTAMLPFSFMGVLAGKLELYNFLGMFLPQTIILILTGLLLFIQRDLHKCKEIFRAIIHSKKDALIEIHKLGSKESLIKRNIANLEHQETHLKQKLIDLESKIQSDQIKYRNWLLSVANEKVKVKREIDFIALDYSAQKIREKIKTDNEENIFDLKKKKKNGNFH